MNAYIKRIIIFGANDEKRVVELTSGLNIITGDSKTGKSAILEIVDYCLFSSRSTIPKGVVENFSDLYSIVLKASDKYIVIGRPSKKMAGGSKAYVSIETTSDFLEKISINYFDALPLRQLKDAQEIVEKHLGISVLDTRLDETDDKRKAGKTTMRSFVPFLFQHQNLIANKHSIFYRFDDHYKRKKTLDDFPVLIGWESSEYFLSARELEEKMKELKAHNKLVQSLKLKSDDMNVRLRTIIEGYYSIVGLELDAELKPSAIKALAKKLPDVPSSSYANSNLVGKIQDKDNERESLISELREAQELLNLLEKNSSLTHGHASELNFLNLTSDLTLDSETLVCPVCNRDGVDLSDDINRVTDSREELKAELEKMGTYSDDNSEQIEQLRKSRNLLKRRISTITSEIKSLEEQDGEIQKSKSLRDQSLLAKGMADANIKALLSNNRQNVDDTEKDELESRITYLQEKLDGFDLKSKIKESEVFLSKKMTDICGKLDFEEELKPGRLQFSLEKFDFYYNYNEKEKIHLSEMGSGANWLACHLSLFLSLLHLNSRELKSSIPSFLFIDQPSQVYFPSKYKEVEDGTGETVDENIVQVKNIFKVISDELSTIEQEVGFLPQVVVMEHADEPEFDEFIKARWTKQSGKKLI
jgi:hypothetical protein